LRDHADPVHLARRLRLGSQRRGEEDKDEEGDGPT
jgi:hypothetical protein